MALKKTDVVTEAGNESLSGKKAKAVFSANAKEKKVLTTFSLEPTFKEELNIQIIKNRSISGIFIYDMPENFILI